MAELQELERRIEEVRVMAGDALDKFPLRSTTTPGATRERHIHDLSKHIGGTGSGGTGSDHGSLTGLGDVADHAYAVLIDGTRALTADWNAGAFKITAGALAVSSTRNTLLVDIDRTFTATTGADMVDILNTISGSPGMSGTINVLKIGNTGALAFLSSVDITGLYIDDLFTSGAGFSGDLKQLFIAPLTDPSGSGVLRPIHQEGTVGINQLEAETRIGGAVTVNTLTPIAGAELTVDGDADFSGHLALVDGTLSASIIIKMQETTSSGSLSGIQMILSGSHSTSSLFGVVGQATATAATTGAVRGLDFQAIATHDSGTVAALEGMRVATVHSSGGGTVTDAIGADLFGSLTSGTTTNFRGVRVKHAVTAVGTLAYAFESNLGHASGTLTDLIGFYHNPASAAGTITNHYGLKIEDVAGASNNFPIHQSGTTGTNILNAITIVQDREVNRYAYSV